jgi:hypothetical protein
MTVRRLPFAVMAMLLLHDGAAGPCGSPPYRLDGSLAESREPIF